jgi:hypothetical protein
MPDLPQKMRCCRKQERQEVEDRDRGLERANSIWLIMGGVGDWSQLVGQASSLLHHNSFLPLTPMANVCSQYAYPDLTRLVTYIPETKSVTPQKAVPAEWLHACLA